jgi:hypothetical protein
MTSALIAGLDHTQLAKAFWLGTVSTSDLVNLMEWHVLTPAEVRSIIGIVDVPREAKP